VVDVTLHRGLADEQLGRDLRIRQASPNESQYLCLARREAIGYPKPRRVAEVLDLIDLASDARTRIGALSGGQRRRVDLGLAIIGQPEMLFLDEPTTGLDPEARRRLWSVIENLIAAGTTVLLTTHYLDEAQCLARRVIVLADGRVVADASPDEPRAMGGVPVIRFRLPDGFPALPQALARVGPAPPGARTARGGTYHAPFGIKKGRWFYGPGQP
jgi:ABC-type multidrug transport system ATPase subunit